MKKIILAAIACLFYMAASAQTSTKADTTFLVFGNCTQCKERIELACDMKGVKFAEWNIETKELRVIYNPTKTDTDKIQKAIAAVGHDSQMVKADSSVYQKLPDCCLYREKPNTHHD